MWELTEVGWVEHVFVEGDANFAYRFRCMRSCGAGRSNLSELSEPHTTYYLMFAHPFTAIRRFSPCTQLM